MNKGIWYAIGAYGVWGMLPIYWKWLRDVPELQVIGHRVVWSFLILLAITFAARRGPQLIAALRRPRVIAAYSATAVLIAINWLAYIWAVNANLIVETSLGYYINPLLSVLMGVIVLRERLRALQWVAIALAGAGVVYLTFVYGRLPWVALTLAFSFTFYGLIKKTTPLDALSGLTIETGVMLLPAVIFLGFVESTSAGALRHADALTVALLLGAGVTTTLPLMLFALAAQRIPLSLIGVLQYIAPTMQFLIAVFVYGEPFSPAQLIGFCMVWAALIIFGGEGLLRYRAQQRRAPILERP
jgi:chloramphenicol-sensitive protein RarD